MKPFAILPILLATAQTALADGFPVVTTQPTNQIVTPGSTAVFGVTATGATGYQWRFNGTDIPGASAATLTVTNPQFTNSGYYLVILKNAFGWTPSQMAYLSVVDTGGLVPGNNLNNSNAQANYEEGNYCYYGYGGPITNGTAQIIAGPQLDQMQAISTPRAVNNGFFTGTTRTVPTVAAGQMTYYRVNITYTNPCGVVTQPSTVLSLVAGGGAYPVPSNTNLYFPIWIEWPDYDPLFYGPSTNQVRLPGEMFGLTYYVEGDTDLGPPSFQWRKDGGLMGSLIPGNETYPYFSTNLTLTFTNVRPSDSGVYDLQVLANNWLISPKIYVSVQLTNGQGVLDSPRHAGTNFLCNLIGAQTRQYTIQQSTDLKTWTDFQTLTNNTGTVTFTNPLSALGPVYYRSRLVP